MGSEILPVILALDCFVPWNGNVVLSGIRKRSGSRKEELAWIRFIGHSSVLKCSDEEYEAAYEKVHSDRMGRCSPGRDPAIPPERGDARPVRDRIGPLAPGPKAATRKSPWTLARLLPTPHFPTTGPFRDVLGLPILLRKNFVFRTFYP